MVIVTNAPVILGRSDDSDDDSAGENVRSTGLDSQPSVSVVLLKTKEKIACFTTDQPRQQKKHKSQSTVSDANAEVTIENMQGGNDLRSILSKEDSFRSLSSNDELEGYKEDVRFLVQISTEKVVLIICDFHRATSVGLGVSTYSIGESSGWMVRKGMHTRQFLQQRTH
uniref:Uncharacterized protein n=1 Tax=Brassica campestris TaxID=3711 RepID=M4EVY3_BRACM